MALRRQSWTQAVAAGAVAGLAEWFRAGSYLVFAVPCLVYALAAWRQGRWRKAALSGGALAGFLASVALGGMTIPSPVNKTVVALWHRLQELDGVQLKVNVPNVGVTTIFMAGLEMSPDPAETNCDYAVHHSHGLSTWRFVAEHREKIFASYLHNLGEACRSGFSGLRETVGGSVMGAFLAALLVSLLGRRSEDVHTLALSGAALAHYAGPILLLRGNEATHYLIVILPLFQVVAAGAAARAWEAAAHWLSERLTPAHMPTPTIRFAALAMALCLVYLSVQFYAGALMILRGYHADGEKELASLDSLGLEGRRVASRTMNWFFDRDVQIRLLPFARVPELVSYTAARDLEGMLLWDRDEYKDCYFSNSPYPTNQEFFQAIEASGCFEPARCAGSWRWYALRRNRFAGRLPSTAAVSQQ